MIKMHPIRRGILLSLIGLAGTLGIFGPGLWELARLSRLQRSWDLRLSQLASERKRLVIEEQRLRSDPTYVEGWIRTTFKQTRPGEYIISLNQKPTADASTHEQSFP